MGGTGSPTFSDHARKSECESKVMPSAAPNEWTHIRSGRDAVIFASFCRSEPAAPLRGLAKGRSPASVSRTFSSSNAFTGK